MRDVETNWLQGQSIKYSESPNFKRFNTTLGRLVWAQTSFLQLPSRCVYTKFNHTYIHVCKYTILCVNKYSFIHIKYINHPLGICLKGLDPWFCCEKTFSQPTPKKQDQQLRGKRYPKQIYKIREQTLKNTFKIANFSDRLTKTHCDDLLGGVDWRLKTRNDDLAFRDEGSDLGVLIFAQNKTTKSGS